MATLVGPLAGGVLVDGLGWQWIFFVNVPVGIIGLVLAVWLIPELATQKQRFDLLGVALSGIGMFMIVFALQEGQSHDWAPWVWGTIAGGIGFMAAFLFWQYVNPNEPLVPLHIFRDRDFSLSNLGVATIGFVVTAMIVPVMFYAQAVCGLSPTRSALLVAPMAIASGVLAPFVGRIVDRSHPRPVIGFGFSLVAIAMTWLSIEMTPTTPIWRVVLPLTATGIGMAFIWSPLAATATRNLPPQLAGAGSGVYNTTRQVGSVLGSAGMAAFMTWRISAEMPPLAVESDRAAKARWPSCRHSCTNRSPPRCRRRCCCPRSSRCSVWAPRCSCSVSATSDRRLSTTASRRGRPRRRLRRRVRRRRDLRRRRRRVPRVHGDMG